MMRPCLSRPSSPSLPITGLPMPFSLRRLRLTAWLALFAVLLGALTPTISRALLASGQIDGWVEVCTAAGMKYVNPLTAAEVDPQTDLQAFAEACPYCAAHAGSFALAAALPAVDTASLSPQQQLPLTGAPLRMGSTDVVLPAPRAPPRLS